jgi:hypothetical protein
MLDRPFLTDIDSRAKVKGSRDPLGIQPIWTRFGRHVIGNLTMASNSVRGFTTLLLGFYFAERVIEENAAASILETFIKWEQLASYARYWINKDSDFRGIERVKVRLGESLRFRLSREAEDQILADQKNYGLWGLYTIPARASGIVDGEFPRLTPDARPFVENAYLDMLTEFGVKNGDRIVNILNDKAPRLDMGGKDKELVVAIGKVLNKKLRNNERDFYTTHLLYGEPNDTTKGLQRQLANLIKETFAGSDIPWSPVLLGQLIEKASHNGNGGQVLAAHLSDIRHCESVVAPVSDLFGYLLGCMDAKVADVIKRIAEVWGKGLGTIDISAVRGMREKLGGGDQNAGDRWVKIAEALMAGGYDEALELVLDQNRDVMLMRGGSPWIVKDGSRLDVRFQGESKDLPKRADLSRLWRFPYFLDSLRKIGFEIEGGLS